MIKTIIIIGNENGKGIKKEIVKLIPSEIPIHNNCCDKNCLLLSITVSHQY
jgi:hypothetical protein